jgi:hypothetical protein
MLTTIVLRADCYCAICAAPGIALSQIKKGTVKSVTNQNRMKNIRKAILRVFSRKASDKNMKSLRMQVYLLNVVRSHAFSKLTLQDKLTSIARLIDIFQKDFGFTPNELQETIKSLKERLDKEMSALWDATYTQYFSKRPGR